jgi:hypothetical protein
MQLMENLELLEIALVQHKIESTKSTEYRRAQAKEKQRRAEARRARHYKEIQQLKRENVENLHFRKENEVLVNQLQMSNSLYESEKNSSKQVRMVGGGMEKSSPAFVTQTARTNHSNVALLSSPNWHQTGRPK